MRTYGDAQREQAAAGADLGAAFNIVVTSDFLRVVVAFSVKQNKHKFPGGRVERADAITANGHKRGHEETVIAGATRELFRETGIVGDREMLSDELAVPDGTDLSGPTLFLETITQPIRDINYRYFCFSILKSADVLGREAVEHEEMRPAELWRIPKVIQLGLRSAFNPLHALALCEWITLLQDSGVEHSADHGKQFGDLLVDLQLEGIDHRRCASEILDRLKSGAI